MEMINIDSINGMIDDMLETDFSDTPNLNALVAMRDALVEMNCYPPEFVNELVSRMTIDVSAATPEEGTLLGARWALLVSKFIEVMYDNGFNDKNIVNMANKFNLSFSDG